MQLNHMIEIQRRGQARDTVGQLKETWKNAGRVWASIRPVSGREYMAASGERAEITHSIILRHGVTVAPRDRIKLGERIFDVVSVMNTGERNRYLKLMIVENANTGI